MIVMWKASLPARGKTYANEKVISGLDWITMGANNLKSTVESEDPLG